MARQKTQAEQAYWFAKQLLANADNLHIPKEVSGQPGAYRLIFLYTLARALKDEFEMEASNSSPWAPGEESQTSRSIQVRWEQRCRAAELMLRGICNILEGVCTGAFYADYVKSKVLSGLQTLDLCEDIETYLTPAELHLLSWTQKILTTILRLMRLTILAFG